MWTDTWSLLRNARDDEGHVVVGRGVAVPPGRGSDQRLDRGRRRRAARRLGEGIEGGRVAELLASVVHQLREAVGEEQDRVAGGERDPGLLVRRAQGPERRSAEGDLLD